jgi:colanic acid biosynthesis glycosyl transferase WcaI
MQKSGNVVIVSQHYPPDPSTTAAIMAEIANHLASQRSVLVVSGSPESQTSDPPPANRPIVIEIRNRMAAKAALVRRAAAEVSFSMRTFLKLLSVLRRGDVVLTVTAPFMLPYAVTAAAKLKRARSALIMHDLFPDVLVMSGLLKPTSLLTKAITGVNALMFQMVNIVIVIGRDTERLLSRYRTLERDKIRFIPNWATLLPAVRPIRSDNPYRRSHAGQFVVGLSGNLGFTHDPFIVFEAAKLLQDDSDIHFLLSGWGVGFERLKELQAEANLPNVTLVGRVDNEDLEPFLCAANVWIIPYRKNVAGVSVPSRFYNLLAIGRPVILVSEPDAEAAMAVGEKDLGWVVMPDMPDQLAKTIQIASRSVDPSIAQRTVAAAKDFNVDRAMTSYAGLVDELFGERKPKEALP